MFSWTNAPIIVAGVSNVISTQTQTTFNFTGRFQDMNILQAFRVDYTLNGLAATSYTFNFTRIKSLSFPSVCANITPTPTFISAPSCQLVNIPVSFSNIPWSNPSESLCFGSITDYEYQLPSGWKIGNNTSTGSNWIAGSNNVTVITNLLGGNGVPILVRAANTCAPNLVSAAQAVAIPVSRPNTPVLQINGQTALTLNCGDVAARTFTVQNTGACITGYEWLVANKGWYNASGALITSNITTTTPSLTLYPSCAVSNPPKDVEVLIKAGTEVLSSKVTVSFSTAKPSLDITGPATICSTGNYTINVSPACGASISWSLEPLANHPNVGSLSCSTCQSPTLTKINNGTALLKALVNFPGCSVTAHPYTKSVGVGTPVFRGWYNGPANASQPMVPWSRDGMDATNPVCYGTPISTTTDITANATVLWEDAGNSGGVNWYQLGNNLYFYFSGPNQWAFFRVTITNSCGTTSLRYRFNSVTEGCTGGPMLLLALTPNPAGSTVGVSLSEKEDNSRRKAIVAIRIADKTGNIRQQWSYNKEGGTAARQIDISALPPDVYTVLVSDGTNWYAQRLVKQ
jgi:hypothetical protein